MTIDMKTLKAMILISYNEGRESLCRELMDNADLFIDQVYHVQNKGVQIELVEPYDESILEDKDFVH